MPTPYPLGSVGFGAAPLSGTSFPNRAGASTADVAARPVVASRKGMSTRSTQGIVPAAQATFAKAVAAPSSVSAATTPTVTSRRSFPAGSWQTVTVHPRGRSLRTSPVTSLVAAAARTTTLTEPTRFIPFLSALIAAIRPRSNTHPTRVSNRVTGRDRLAVATGGTVTVTLRRPSAQAGVIPLATATSRKAINLPGKMFAAVRPVARSGKQTTVPGRILVPLAVTTLRLRKTIPSMSRLVSAVRLTGTGQRRLRSLGRSLLPVAFRVSAAAQRSSTATARQPLAPTLSTDVRAVKTTAVIGRLWSLIATRSLGSTINAGSLPGPTLRRRPQRVVVFSAVTDDLQDRLQSSSTSAHMTAESVATADRLHAEGRSSSVTTDATASTIDRLHQSSSGARLTSSGTPGKRTPVVTSRAATVESRSLFSSDDTVTVDGSTPGVTSTSTSGTDHPSVTPVRPTIWDD